MSQTNRQFRDAIPQCPRCGNERMFEMQIMPQIFFKLPDLVNVDWDTIVIHTCVNTECLPDFHNDEYYIKEHAYVQLNSDFCKVKYGTEQQIADQKKLKAKQLEEEQKFIEENKEEIDKMKAQSEE